MGTDRRESYHVGCRVDDRATARQVIGSAASRCRNEHTITLHDGQRRVVDINVETAHELSIASGECDLIERVADRR